MTSFVLDASVSMAWCFADELDEYSNAVLSAFSTLQAVVPQLWPIETANTLVIGERKGRLSEQDTRHYLDLLAMLPITVDKETTDQAMPSIIAASRKYNLTAYDAAYLELALRKRLPLASRDQALVKACNKAGVPLYGGFG